MDTTIKDIAEKLNISYSTVSRALNNKYGVKAETREKILEASKEMNYHPNAIARGLVNRQTHTIGLIIPDIKNPFYPEIAGGIEEIAADSGYNVFLCNTNWSKDRENQYINLLSERRVDGIIAAPVSSSVRNLEMNVHKRIPLVYVSKAPEDTDNSFVVIDDVRGGFLATKHLIESGYETIGFIGAADGDINTDERFKGYVTAFEKFGMVPDDKYVRCGDFRQTTGYNIIRSMIKENDYPRAIFAENDLIALGVIQAVKDLGLKVPGDIAIVGFDDIPIASMQEIQLSTICQPKYQMGKIAFENLLEIIKGNNKENSSRKVILEPELIVRSSSQ